MVELPCIPQLYLPHDVQVYLFTLEFMVYRSGQYFFFVHIVVSTQNFFFVVVHDLEGEI